MWVCVCLCMRLVSSTTIQTTCPDGKFKFGEETWMWYGKNSTYCMSLFKFVLKGGGMSWISFFNTFTFSISFCEIQVRIWSTTCLPVLNIRRGGSKVWRMWDTTCLYQSKSCGWMSEVGKGCWDIKCGREMDAQMFPLTCNKMDGCDFFCYTRLWKTFKASLREVLYVANH